MSLRRQHLCNSSSSAILPKRHIYVRMTWFYDKTRIMVISLTLFTHITTLQLTNKNEMKGVAFFWRLRFNHPFHPNFKKKISFRLSFLMYSFIVINF